MAHVGRAILDGWGCVSKRSLHVLHAPTLTLLCHDEKSVSPTATSKTIKFLVYLEAGHVIARTTAT